jgi:hypothetical protein
MQRMDGGSFPRPSGRMTWGYTPARSGRPGTSLALHPMLANARESQRTEFGPITSVVREFEDVTRDVIRDVTRRMPRCLTSHRPTVVVSRAVFDESPNRTSVRVRLRHFPDDRTAD